MPLRVEPNAEPIPGYRLIERLGGGGFGEVWKAEVPGGLFKAIKFVYGEISVDDTTGFDDPDGAKQHKQELKSLGRVKSVHHPFILSLERYEVIQGQLVIVMELADQTLWDRFKECRGLGLPGIPREELLGYLEETAEALDLMNSEYQLQHLDIKPQNIFLVYNHVKVADFGLVKDLVGKQNATVTGGVTPVYAAPETFDGWLSRQSDQYSLAIVYQELLTGQRPFAGSTMKQLILHHLQSAPDLSALPLADRPIVARALAKNPEDRFPSCCEFAQLLREATNIATASMDGKDKSGSAETTPLPMDTSANVTAGARGGAGPIKPADPNFSTEAARIGNRPQILPPRPENEPREHLSDSKSSKPGFAKSKREPTGLSTQELPGLLQPALVIGLGKLGVDALAQLRRRLVEEFGQPDALPQLRLLAIDTDPDSLQQATSDPSRAALQMQEVLLSRLQRPAHYIKSRDGKLPTDVWLNPKHLHRIPREQQNAGLRALGRLAFVDNYRQIAKRLEAELRTCASPHMRPEESPTQGLGLRSLTPRVYIIASLAGNTGSGMFLDIAYLVRKLLREQGHEAGEIVGVFFVPAARREPQVAAALANTFAALVELHHFSRAESLFTARYETAASSSKDQVTETGPAFHRCVTLLLPELAEPLRPTTNHAVLATAGDFLCRDLTTVLGPTIDEQRRLKVRLSNEWLRGLGPLLQSVGLFRMHWPRHAVLEQCARGLCARLVTRWMIKDAKPLAETISQWTHERWEALGMRPENLIERFQKLVEEALQQPGEHALAEALGPLQEALAGEAKDAQSVRMAPVMTAMERLETIIGSPEENRTAAQIQTEPSLLERTLVEAARVIADACEQQLAELAVRLLEDPSYRLAGAEEALRQFCTVVDQALQSQEPLAKELTEKAAQLHLRIQQLTEPAVPDAPATATWKINLTRRPSSKGGPSAKDIFELVRTYAKTRYHSLILTHLNRLYVSLRGHLSDQIREVGFCRQRLSELLGLLQPLPMARQKMIDKHAGERILFPTGCLEMGDAVAKVNNDITPEDLFHFDERVQAWINANCQALLQVCMGTSSMVRNLAPAMIQEAEAFLDVRLRGASVAEMYVTRMRSDDEENPDDPLVDDLERCHDAAAPELGRLSESNEVAVTCLPNDESGKHMQRLLKKHFPELKIILTDRQDEVVICREIINIPWKDLEQLGAIAQEAFDKRQAADPSLHSRDDIAEWQSPLAVVK